MRPSAVVATAILAVVVLSGCASWFGADAPAATADGVFVNQQGMTLYTFDRDRAGNSACNEACAVNWPPLLAPVDAPSGKDWATITREDGRRQWAYRGKPLYAWVKDEKPGDRTGEGVGNLWRLARP